MITCDGYAIIKYKHNDNIVFKLFVGSRSSYLEGESWRLNSGIVDVYQYKDGYIIKGVSGSEYLIYPDQYMYFSSYIENVLNDIVSKTNSEIINLEELLKLYIVK